MKILLVITKAELGGAQRFVRDMAIFLRQAGHDVTVGYGTSGHLIESLGTATIATHRFQTLERSFNPFSALSFARELKNFVAEQGFDVVHCNSSNTLPGILLLSSLRKRPVTVATLHGLSFAAPEHSSPFKSFYTFLYRTLLRSFDKTVYISQRDRDNGLRTGLPEGYVVPLGIPEGRLLERNEARRKLVSFTTGADPRRFLIGFIGRLAYPKNIGFVVEHFDVIQKNIPNAQLLAIGDGPERPELVEKIKHRHLENDIFLLGSTADAAQYLKGIDLLVIPSVYEGVPYIALEALQARTPLLASAVGGLPELLPEQNLFELTAEDFDYKISLLKAKNFPAFPLPENRNIDRMAEAYLSLYRN